MKSWQTFVYKITATEALSYNNKETIPIAKFETRTPNQIVSTDSYFEDELSTGFYVFISIVEHKVVAELYNKSSLQLIAINNKHRLQLDVRTRLSMPVQASQIMVNGKKAIYNTSSRTFWVKKKRFEEATVVVYSEGDTLIAYITEQDELRYPLGQQRLRNLRSSKFYKTINWLPKQIGQLFSTRKPLQHIGANGFIAFNQPKYKPLDTVRFKGYVVDKKNKRYLLPVEVYLQYMAKGNYKTSYITTINPTKEGSYIGEFVIADSLPSDINCDLVFKTKTQKKVISKKFAIEDYVLDDIANYAFTADKSTYYKKDSIQFTASAKDANGLFIQDIKARLILTTNSIEKWFADTLFVRDTLYDNDINMLTDRGTTFSVPATIFPAANIAIEAVLVFKNANNELQEEVVSLNYIHDSKTIDISLENDSIVARYLENGVSTVANGTMYINDGEDQEIRFPYSAKIDPMVEDYTFEIDKDDLDLSEAFSITSRYDVNLIRNNAADTLGFILNNPNAVPVYYTVLDGRNVIATGKSDNKRIEWRKKMKNVNQLYRVRWQYYWGGEEQQNESSIAVLHKILNIRLLNSDKVFPGQQDSLKVAVTDYLGKPASKVNLTAMSYNNQLSKDIQVKEPPYLVRYANKKYLQWDGFTTEETDELLLKDSYSFGNYPTWKNKFALDTMTYYKLLFPNNGLHDYVTPTKKLLPQLSVYVVDNGVPQEIYLLYINRNLVYYNNVTDNRNVVFEAYPTNVQLQIRLLNKTILLDSIYLQPYYKHHLSIDVNNLPKGAVVTETTPYYTTAEMNLIEKSMWMMQNDYENNKAYIWQGNRVVKLEESRPHIIGPFNQGQRMYFYSPNNFDIDFLFEPGYEYKLSKQIFRLEKKAIFPDKTKKNFLIQRGPHFSFADTLMEVPDIVYPKMPTSIYLPTSVKFSRLASLPNTLSNGKVLISAPKDSVYKYVALRGLGNDTTTIVLSTSAKILNNIPPGKYQLYLVMPSAQIVDAIVEVTPNGTLCVDLSKQQYHSADFFIHQLKVKAQQVLNAASPVKSSIDSTIRTIIPLDSSLVFQKEGGASIAGVVMDKKGKFPIYFCTVSIKGTNAGTISDANGNFVLERLKPGSYTLVFAQVGYTSTEISVEVKDNFYSQLNVQLTMNENHLEDVVIVGYGTSKKRSMTFSMTSIRSEELTVSASPQNWTTLIGKVPGVTIDNTGALGRESSLMMRSANAVTSFNTPLYIIDGILYDQPQQIDEQLIKSIEVLKSSEAVGIYGSRAVNGVIVITTYIKTERKQFKDHAFWIPELITNKEGKASALITYPDNITGWQTYILAFDKKRRMGKASMLTQSYKPLQAVLSMPSFLQEGDSSFAVTKGFNYTADDYNIKSSFYINNQIQHNKNEILSANKAITSTYLITSKQTDNLTAMYEINSSTAFKDAEERNIPVFKNGTEESVGQFWVLRSDTTVGFSGASNNGITSVYVQNNSLELMLEELEHLKSYPYFCMEQICSKLKGLVLEKKIKAQLKQPFAAQKEIDELLKKLLQAQQFDGGWAWWENGKSNFYITNYILQSLLEMRDNQLVASAIRNGFLYLQNQLPSLNRDYLLAALVTLSNGGHQMNYALQLDKIPFDSISIHQQWQWVSIQQQQQLEYADKLEDLYNTKVTSVLGGMHWGIENYQWYSNEIATTVLAYKVLSNEQKYQQSLPAILQYFLEKKGKGYWRNTLETASILNVIIPSLLASQPNFLESTMLKVSGDTSFTIHSFPAKFSLNHATLNFNKTGGGWLYVTAYQTFFNTTPKAVTDPFVVSTYFKQQGQNVSYLKAGSKATMVLRVDVLKDAEFVMIDVPIPAGCIFTNKTNDDWLLFKEFRKNKLLMFTERLTKGVHYFEVEVEPRYNGNYHLNPAKVELMYFPTFFGRNSIRKIEIVD